VQLRLYEKIALWVAGALVAGFVIMLVAFWWSLPKRVTNTDKYSKILEDWKPTDLVDHFPHSIPSIATNVKFSAEPGFLQGGGHIQLRMELPPSEVRKLFDDATKNAKQTQDGGNSVTSINERDDGLHSASPYTLDSDSYEFPTDYRVFIFHARNSGSWNHGDGYGVVISLQRDEVIYYANYW
jgi:hypothetical protein